jgi:hypothetical protein
MKTANETDAQAVVAQALVAMINAHDSFGNPSPQLRAARRAYKRAVAAAAGLV